MNKKVDTFTVSQASMALGVTPKRIRQMIAEGKLTAHSTEPTLIKQTEVIELKVTREKSGRTSQGSKNTSQSTANADLLAQISNLIEQSSETNRRAIELVQESAQRNEQNLIAQVNELKAELDRLRAHRGFFRR